MVKKAKGETTHYVFEGTEPIFEKKITNGERRSYVYALGTYLARVDGVISKNNEEVYFYHNDDVGSIRAMTDRAGKVVYNADYLAFGKKFGVTAADDGFDEYHGFTGKEYDPDTGLYYYNARWYDQDLGRFVSEDPAADPNNPNLYSYCGNNPVIRNDPTGELFAEAAIGSILCWLVGAIDLGSEVYNKGGDFWSGFSYGLTNTYTIMFSSGGSNTSYKLPDLNYALTQEFGVNSDLLQLSPSIEDGLANPNINLASLLDTIKITNPGILDIKAIHENKIIIRTTGIRENVIIGNIAVNGDYIMIEKLNSMGNDGSVNCRYEISVVDELHIFGGELESGTSKIADSIGNILGTGNTYAIGWGNSKNNVMLYADIAFNSKGFLMAKGNVGFERRPRVQPYGSLKTQSGEELLNLDDFNWEPDDRGRLSIPVSRNYYKFSFSIETNYLENSVFSIGLILNQSNQGKINTDISFIQVRF